MKAIQHKKSTQKLDEDPQGWLFFLQTKKMEAIGSLASGLAHDFNNILTSIHASTQTLHTCKHLTDDQIEAIADIENRVICGAEVVKQLLSFSKPDKSRSSSVYVNQRISMLRRLLTRLMPKHIRIDLNLMEEEATIRMIASELEQILLNLVINARDAMPNGGTINIKTSMIKWNTSNPAPIPEAVNGTYVKIEVSDDGRGISARNMSKIFDPYFSSKHSKGGTGLGLSIVYSIAQRYNGYVIVNSVISKGTTFTLFMPGRRKRLTTQTNRGKSEPPQQLGGNETILLVEDEPIIAKSTSHFLERYGYRIITACDGKRALSEFNKNRKQINLVLLDLEIPQVNGLKCLEEMLAIHPKTKVITMSGHFIQPEIWDPIKAGARAFIQKPFNSENLLDVIRSTMNRC